MEAGGKKILSREEIALINQLMNSLIESSNKLEEYHNKKDYDNFNNLKNFMFSISKKISNSLK
jgi:hypothetical protein|tara:strand:- start:214 stop:402 length:189 start_codon:yes stop_codon:yes gene_type:complete